MLSTWSTVTSALSAACASLRIRSVPVRAPALPPLSAMTVIMTTPVDGRLTCRSVNGVGFASGARRSEFCGGVLVEQPHRGLAADRARGGHIHRLGAADRGGHRVRLGRTRDH